MDQTHDMSQAAQLLRRYVDEQDKTALEHCLSSCLGPAYRQAYAELGNDADAQDAAQEALLQLVRNAHRYDADRPLAPWLARHVTFACSHLRRSNARRLQREGQAMAEQVLQHVEQSSYSEAELDALRKALAELSDKDRHVISMHYIRGLSQAETAAALNMKENAVAVRIHRARGKLKKILTRSGYAASLTLLPVLLQAAPQVPMALLPKVLTTCAASSLPTTTISLGILQKGMMTVQLHPILSTLTALCLSFCTIGSAYLIAADAEPTKEQPVSVQQQQENEGQAELWNPAAAKLLKLYDPDALIQFAADADAVKNILLDTQPLKTIVETDDRNLYDNWLLTARQLERWYRMTGEDTSRMPEVWLAARGLYVQLNGRMEKQHRQNYVAIDVSEETPALIDMLAPDIKRGQKMEAEGWQRDRGMRVIGPRMVLDGTSLVYMQNQDSTEHVQKKLQEQKPHREVQQHAAWMELSTKKLIQEYAKYPELDHMMRGFLGAQWQQVHPHLKLHLQQADDRMQFIGEIKDVPVAGPWIAGVLAMAQMRMQGVLPQVPLQFKIPQHLPAPDDKALLELRFACDYSKHAQLAETIQQELHGLLGDAAKPLAQHLNGECLLRVYEGMPIPGVALVLGLNKGHKVHQACVPTMADLGALKQQTDHGLGHWSLFTPVGLMHLVVMEDRFFITNQQTFDQLKQSHKDRSAFVLDIDTQRIVQQWGPMLWNMLPNEMVFPNMYVPYHFHVSASISNNRSRLETNLNNLVDTYSRNQWLGIEGENDLNRYISVWMHKDDLDNKHLHRVRTKMVFRTREAFHVTMGVTAQIVLGYESEEKLAKELDNFKHVAGFALKDLIDHPRGPLPIIKRKTHIPEFQHIIASMPRYTLRWDQKGRDSQRFEETGFPLATLLCAVAMAELETADPLIEARSARELMDLDAAFKKHDLRLQQLWLIVKAMNGKQWRRASDLLKHAPKEALPGLGLGKQPSAEKIDALGHWFAFGRNSSFTYDVTTAASFDAQHKTTMYGQFKWAFKLDEKTWVHIGENVVGITFDEPPFLDRVRQHKQRQQQKVKKPQKQEAAEDIDF